MTTEDLSWLAGIWEGEGTACITTQYQRRPYKVGKRIAVSISQKDVSMLVEVKRLTGIGSIHSGTRASAWCIGSREAREFLRMIRPFVRSTRRQCQIDDVLARDATARLEGKESLRHSNRTRPRTVSGQFVRQYFGV